jgi:hypothetical protein
MTTFFVVTSTPKQLIFVPLPHTQHYDLVPSYYDYIEHPFGGWIVRTACIDNAHREVK